MQYTTLVSGIDHTIPSELFFCFITHILSCLASKPRKVSIACCHCNICNLSTRYIKVQITKLKLCSTCVVFPQEWSGVLLGNPLHSWFKRNGNCSIIHAQSSIHWAIMFLTGTWNLWLHRNAVIFSNKCLNPRLKYLSLSHAMEILPIYPQTMHLQPGLLCFWNEKHLRWAGSTQYRWFLWKSLRLYVQKSKTDRERLKNIWIWYYVAHSVTQYKSPIYRIEISLSLDQFRW